MSDFTPEQLTQLERALLTRRDDLRLQIQAAGNAAAPVALDQQRVGRASRIDAIAGRSPIPMALLFLQ